MRHIPIRSCINIKVCTRLRSLNETNYTVMLFVKLIMLKGGSFWKYFRGAHYHQTKHLRTLQYKHNQSFMKHQNMSKTNVEMNKR